MMDLLRRSGIGTWMNKKVVDPFVEILRRGAEPKQLAFSVALGVTLGLFPIVGVPFFFCVLAIAMLGTFVNAPTVMLANFVITPIEVSLVIVFLRIGEFVTGGAHFPLTSDALKRVLTGKASLEIFLSIVHAMLGWLVMAPFILGLVYIILLPCFTILVRKFSVSSMREEATAQVTVMLKEI